MKRQAVEPWDARYGRVSTDMQMERDALQNQVQALEAHAAAHGLKVRLSPEEGVWAKDTGRPRLPELLVDVRAGCARSWSPSSTASAGRGLAALAGAASPSATYTMVASKSARAMAQSVGKAGRYRDSPNATTEW